MSIAKPGTIKKAEIAAQTELTAVEVREVNGPEGASVLWRILTAHTVSTCEEAVRVVNNYRQRWYIEQLFRLLKKKGFKIESSELKSGWAIRKLAVMILNSALRVMQLLLAHGNEESQPINQVFDEGEIQCLQQINNTLQGDTEKRQKQKQPPKIVVGNMDNSKIGRMEKL